MSDFLVEELKPVINLANAAQKMKISLMDFFSKCDQILKKLRIWSHLLNESLMEKIFMQCNNLQSHGYSGHVKA